MKFFLVVFVMVSQMLVFSQPNNKKLKKIVNAVLERSEEISMYGDSTNWASIQNEVYLKSKNVNTISELKPAFESLINALRDHHARVLMATDYSILAHFTDHSNIRYKDTRAYDSEMWRSVNDPDAKFEFELLEDHIGYLKIVAIGPNTNGQAEAEKIRNAIYAFDKQGVDQWIIDLRYNGGGNANVMLSGLVPLFDTNKIAGVQKNNGEILGWGEITNGNYQYFGYEGFPISDNHAIKSPKIAVLTSRYTVSSGELVAVAFKGQKNVRFFGEATGGYTTNTSGENILESVILVIATGVFCDRTGQSYPHNVPVDELIDFKVESDKTKDLGIKTANEWLKR